MGVVEIKVVVLTPEENKAMREVLHVRPGAHAI